MVAAFDKERVCAVIITYNPDADFGKRAARIATQVGSLIIVDNGSDPETVALLGRVSCDVKAELIRNGQNLGVATALNQGVMLADVKGYQWALTLDQDTVPRDNMTETLIGIYAASTEREKLAVVGSGYPPWVQRGVVITSGSLMSINAFRLIGRFRDDLFVDHVDTEYCLRARSKGFRIATVCTPLMEHVIGAPSFHRLPWKQTETTNHPAIRRYYMTRNVIILFRTYLMNEPICVLLLLWSWLKSTLLMLLFENDRAPKLRAIAAGIADGCGFTPRA